VIELIRVEFFIIFKKKLHHTIFVEYHGIFLKKKLCVAFHKNEMGASVSI
jgi:hypothetical protein